MTAAKRGRGRPSLTGETGQRYQVTIPPAAEVKLRRYGRGSLSRGIIEVASLIPARGRKVQESP